MIAGCAVRGVKIDRKRLLVLNVGIDILLAVIYPGKLPQEKGWKPEHFRIPMMCNAFANFGRNPDPYHYFGRDFMFVTGQVFQDTACLIIYNPDRGLPFVSVTAPRII